MRGLLLISISVAFIVLLAGCSSKNKKEIRKLEESLYQNEEDVVMGDSSAENTIYLYASYKCNYCRYLFSRTFPLLKENYLDKRSVKVVIKWVEFGDDKAMNYALKVGSCISRFGAYDKFHQLLLVNPNVVETEDFHELVNDIMADNVEIAQCVLSNDDFEVVINNTKEFRKLNFTGTPTMVINKKVYSGYMSFDDLDKILRDEFVNI